MLVSTLSAKNGNLLNDGTITYTYDAAMRLTGVSAGWSTTTYAYNGDGDRVSQTVGSVATTYVLDTDTSLTMVLAETTGSETIIYLHGLGLVAQSDVTRCPPACVDKAGIKIPSARIPAEARGEYLLRGEVG